VNWARTLNAHGLTDLPPLFRQVDAGILEVTLPVGGGARTVVLTPEDAATLAVDVRGRRPSAAATREITATLRRMLCLDEDLSGFYDRIAGDDALGWATAGAGRLMRSPTVFEDVIKTICTTNCAWSATVRMVGAIVGRLGTAVPGAAPDTPHGRAFPSPAAMARASQAFYSDVARAGYRGPYMRRIAEMVVTGELDLEALAASSAQEISDDEVRARLEELPGVGPYASAHIMLLIGRRSFLVLDSWTRPTYARISGRKAADRTIQRRFRRYGPYAGLAFWLYVTQDWEDDGPPPELA
jgi:N-glycosylase/DNA lyase